MNSIFFIDGFNLYHSIDKNFAHQKYKWLNLYKLAKQFIQKDEKIKDIYYFSAYCTWDDAKKMRHKQYVKALSSTGVQIIMGNYQSVTKKFKKGKTEIIFPGNYDESNLPNELHFLSYEEKKTDVNIAIKIVENAFKHRYDHAYIISGDSDLVPAVKLVKNEFPETKFTCILPFHGAGFQMQSACNNSFIITEDHLIKSLFDDEMAIGNFLMRKPIEWN